MNATTVDLGGILINDPGRYNIPESAYHEDPLRHLGGSLSSTTARKLLPPSCPALARHSMLHPEYKDAWDLGSVTHSLTLGAGCNIVEVPADSWTAAGKAGKEAKEQARADGAVPLLSKDLTRARAMRDAVHGNPEAHALLSMPGAPEQTLAWREHVPGTDEYVWCRAMLDYWPGPIVVGAANPEDGGEPPAIVDLKKTGKGLDDESLSRTIWEYKHHCQEDWYRRGYYAVHGVWPEFYFVFVSDSQPHIVRVVECDDELRVDARLRNDDALRVWHECQTSGEWPEYGGGITTVGAPRWAYVRES